MAERSPTEFATQLRKQLETLRESIASEIPDVDWSPMVLFGEVAALSNLLRSFYDELLADLELTRSEQAVLGILRGGSTDAPGDLARITQQSAAGMTRTVDRLAARGLVTRHVHASDRRKQRIALTQAGGGLAETMLRAEVAAQQDLLQGLGAAERAALSAALETLMNRLAPRPSEQANSRVAAG